MSVAESMLQKFGGLVLPPSGDAETGGASLDPARDMLLEFFQAVINSELGDAWVVATAGLPGNHPVGKSATPVAWCYPDEPTQQVLTQAKVAFPILALHRSGAGTFGDYGLERDKLTQPWRLHYIVGPLDVCDQRKLKDFGVAAAKCIRLAIRQRRHKAYQNGALQFFSDTSALAGVELQSFEVGPAVFTGGDSGSPFWAAEMVLETVELSGWVEGSEESGLDGMDLVVGVGDEHEIAPALVLGSTDSET
jgi:hypothetical protein